MLKLQMQLQGCQCSPTQCIAGVGKATYVPLHLVQTAALRRPSKQTRCPIAGRSAPLGLPAEGPAYFEASKIFKSRRYSYCGDFPDISGATNS